MKKRVLFVLILIILIFSIQITAFAHSGKTDDYGGHWDSDTGEYHYHHGYPPHYHTDGICPYGFDDRTDHSPSNSYSSGYSNKYSKNDNADSTPGYTSEYEPEVQAVIKEVEVPVEVPYIPIAVYLIIGALALTLVILIFIKVADKNNYLQKNNEMKKECQKEIEERKKLEAKIEDLESRIKAIVAQYEKALMDNTVAEMQISYVEEDFRYLLSAIQEYLGSQNKQLTNLAGAQDNEYIIDSKFPAIKDDSPHLYGEKYTFYSPSLNEFRYHSPGCRYAQGEPINALYIKSAPEWYKPCKICNPKLPDIEWVKKYQKLIELIEKYTETK